MSAFGRTFLSAVVLVAAALAILVPAAGAKTCAQAVIDDWWDNGKVDEVYDVQCYRQAMDALPEDLAGYSSAADDINRALQDRLREQQSVGGGSSGSTDGGSGSGTETGPGGVSTEAEPGTETEDGASTEEGGTPVTGGSGDGGSGGAGAENGEEGTPVEGPVAAPAENLFGEDLDDGSGSLPVPLIVVIAALGLAALAVTVKLVLGRRAGPGGSSADSPGAGLGA